MLIVFARASRPWGGQATHDVSQHKPKCHLLHVTSAARLPLQSQGWLLSWIGCVSKQMQLLDYRKVPLRGAQVAATCQLKAKLHRRNVQPTVRAGGIMQGEEIDLPERAMALSRSRMERVMGIEPTLVAWEATVLPLNYTRADAEPHRRGTHSGLIMVHRSRVGS